MDATTTSWATLWLLRGALRAMSADGRHSPPRLGTLWVAGKQVPEEEAMFMLLLLLLLLYCSSLCWALQLLSLQAGLLLQGCSKLNNES